MTFPPNYVGPAEERWWRGRGLASFVILVGTSKPSAWKWKLVFQRHFHLLWMYSKYLETTFGISSLRHTLFKQNSTGPATAPARGGDHWCCSTADSPSGAGRTAQGPQLLRETLVTPQWHIPLLESWTNHLARVHSLLKKVGLQTGMNFYRWWSSTINLSIFCFQCMAFYLFCLL